MRPLVRQPKVFVHISKRNTHKPCSLWLLYVSVYLSLANQLFFNEENKMNSQKELQKVHWSWKELSESRSIWSKNIILLLPFHAFHHASSRFIVFFTFGSSLHVRFFVCCVVWALIMFFAKKMQSQPVMSVYNLEEGYSKIISEHLSIHKWNFCCTNLVWWMDGGRPIDNKYEFSGKLMLFFTLRVFHYYSLHSARKYLASIGKLVHFSWKIFGLNPFFNLI